MKAKTAIFNRLFKGLVSVYKSGNNDKITKEKLEKICESYHAKGLITDSDYEEDKILIQGLEEH